MQKIIEALEHVLCVIEAEPETQIVCEVGEDVYQVLQLLKCRLKLGDDLYWDLYARLGPVELLGQWVEKPASLTASISA